jgi:hypothetical protein
MTNTIFKSKGLLAIVILLYLTSCEGSSEIGLELQDGSTLVNTLFTDTLTLETSVIRLDSVNSTINNNFSRLLVGSLKDERFGKSMITAYLQLLPPFIQDGSAVQLGDVGAVFDSAVIRMRYELMTGDENKALTFELFELEEKIDTITYYTKNTLAMANRPISSTTVVPAQDSLRLLRFRADALGSRIFDFSGQDELREVNFINFIKGIAVVPSGDDDAFVLGLFRNTQNFADYSLDVYFRNPNDTISRFQRFTFARTFYHVETDLSQSKLAGLEIGGAIPTSALDNEAYVQFASGITTIIRIPHLRSLAADRRFIVNRADLFFEPVLPLITPQNPPPSALSLYPASATGTLQRFGSSGLPLILLAEGQNQVPVNLRFNPNARTYPVALLTSFTDNIFRGREPNNGLILGPVLDAFRQSQQEPFAEHSANRLVLHGPDASAGEFRMRVRLYYTIF